MSQYDFYRNLTRNILKAYRCASPEDVLAGREWYDLAFTHCERLAWRHGFTVTQSAVALAHLSPRIRWWQNLQFLELLLSGQPKPHFVMTRSWDIASRSLKAENPLDSFSRVALKTGNFARAILGDPNAVVIDVWAARAAGVGESMIRSSGGYHHVAEAYRRGAHRVGIQPRELQAITWVHTRGQAA